MYNPEGFEYVASQNCVASFNGDQVRSDNWNSCFFIVECTVDAGTDEIEISLELYDPINDEYDVVHIFGTKVDAVTTTTYFMGVPEAAGSALASNNTCDILLPRYWRLVFTNSGTDGITFSVGIMPVGT